MLSYHGSLAFNLDMTFWIGEAAMGMIGLLMHLSLLFILIVRLTRRQLALSTR